VGPDMARERLNGGNEELCRGPRLANLGQTAEVFSFGILFHNKMPFAELRSCAQTGIGYIVAA
jgi:hypothetical protein